MAANYSVCSIKELIASPAVIVRAIIDSDIDLGGDGTLEAVILYAQAIYANNFHSRGLVRPLIHEDGDYFQGSQPYEVWVSGIGPTTVWRVDDNLFCEY